MTNKQPWIGKPLTDILFILLPPFICLLIIALFPALFTDEKGISVAHWVVLILLIDVAHVYSTLYRTYFDPVSFRKQKKLLLAIPFIGFFAGVLVYSLDPLWFWRLLAYVAVFHFVRQQYGFMRLYSRHEIKKPLTTTIDSISIYYATLFPILYWHLSGPRNFNWFIENDFLYVPAGGVLTILTVLYYLVIAAYILKEILVIARTRKFNIPKFLIMSGTFLSWYFGIVYFNGDLAFTLLNVVSHGIPYMALVWLYGQKNYVKNKKGTRFLQVLFSRYGLILFMGLLFLFAFVEEGLWDIGVWREHDSVFGIQTSKSLPAQALVFLVPLLAVPQITHYILDGFIWKIRKDDFKWKSEVTNPATEA